MFQETHTKWINNKPFVYYPWQPNYVSQSIHHQLTTDTSLQLQKMQTLLKESRLKVHNDLAEKYSREFYINTVNTTDKNQVSYADLYSDTKDLSSMLTFERENGSLLCHILVLYNPINPHIKSINCYRQFLKSFICETIITVKSTTPMLNPEVQDKRYGLMKCSNGQYISTLHTCDGHQDCSDGIDEMYCFCYKNRKKLTDNIYCSKKCSLKTNCTCSTLFTNHGSVGCHSFVDPKLIENKVLYDVSNYTQFTYSCMYSNFNISNMLVNDLVFDCPNQDDEPELLNELENHGKACIDQNMHECYPGHSRCYTNDQKCIYNLTLDLQTLMYCRNGQHLQGCETKSCLWMFKCPDSYCIPYRYNCDGKWDCWNGEDEINCRNYSCINMFKCKLSSICIHTNNVCDGTIDCPLEDDEIICIETNCIDECTCLNYGISCQHTKLTKRESISSILNYFIFIKITGIDVLQRNIILITNAVIIIIRHSGLLQPFICHPTLASIRMKILDVSFNKINKLHKDNFICFPHLIKLLLDHNEITLVAESLFNNLTNLKVLKLNSNQIASLFKCSFCSLNNLVLLDLLNNSILFVDTTIFGDTKIHFILTDAFPVCCMYSDTGSVCTAQPLWPSSCQTLLSNIGLKLACWSMGIIVVLCNFISIISNAIPIHDKRKLNNFDIYVIGMNSSDLIVGFYLIIMSSADIIFGDDYLENDLLWRSSLPCHVICFISLLAVLISTFFILSISIERYKVVKYPLSAMQRNSKKTEVVFSMMFPILISIVMYIRNQVEGLSYLSSPLCILLGKSEDSVTQNIVTVIVSVYLLLSLFITLILYYKLIILSTQSNKILEKVTQMNRQKSVTLHVLLVGFTNAICWIPSSIFYLVSVFDIKASVALLYWITLVILPTNAMINPIIFNFSKIKSKICTQK